MPVFQIRNGKAQQLDTAEFKPETELQQFFENNLEELLSIHFVEREYVINSKSGRIDTLGIDESNRPVIIEYKLGNAGDEVLTQGLAYRKWLNNNRKPFDLLVKQKYNVEAAWELIRLIFIAKDFAFKMREVAEDDKSVVLIRYSLIQSGLIVLDKISGQLNWARKNIASISGRADSEGVERYLVQTKPELHEPFHQLRKRVRLLSDIEEVIQPKIGITYYTIKAIARFEFRKNHIDLLLKSGASSADQDQRLRDITSNKWGFPLLFQVKKPEDVEYAFNLIQATYQAAM